MYDVYIINNNITNKIHSYLANGNKIISGKIKQSINSIPSFEFEILSNNPYYNNLLPKKTEVYVYNTKKQKYEFEGRIIKLTKQMDNNGIISTTAICEGYLGLLCDSIQIYKAETTYSDTTAVVIKLLNDHYQQFTQESEHRIELGEIDNDVFPTNLKLSFNYETTFSYLKKLIDSYGGEFRLRKNHSNNKFYLDVKKQFGNIKNTTIELGKNIESQSREIDITTIVTRLIPLGAKIKKTVVENGVSREVETDCRLTVHYINNNRNFIEDTIAKNLYGIIYATQIFNEITDENELYQKAEEWLQENNKLKISDTISALDLSLLGIDLDDFELYDSYRCVNYLLDIDDTLRIVSNTIDIIEPYQSNFTLGNTEKSLSKVIINNKNQLSLNYTNSQYQFDELPTGIYEL